MKLLVIKVCSKHDNLSEERGSSSRLKDRCTDAGSKNDGSIPARLKGEWNENTGSKYRGQGVTGEANAN